MQTCPPPPREKVLLQTYACMLCTKKKYVNPFVFYWSNVTHTLKTVGMMCWQDCWGCDGPGSFHILVWTKELKLMARCMGDPDLDQCPRLIILDRCP